MFLYKTCCDSQETVPVRCESQCIACYTVIAVTSRIRLYFNIATTHSTHFVTAFHNYDLYAVIEGSVTRA